MCNFFSLNSNGHGEIYYFDWVARKKLLASKEEPDSHTTIAHQFGFTGKKEDTLNKWEYNPLTKELICDQCNTTDDSKLVLKQCKKLDFKKIVPLLIIKPVIHPFCVKPPTRITAKHLQLLWCWASVGASVRDSVGASVRDSVGASVRDSVWASVWASVGASVGASVWDSVWDSVGAYTFSFFRVKQNYGFASVVKLWKMGLVPSFDGNVWRLHGGRKGKILWEGKF